MERMRPLLVVTLVASILLPGCTGVGPARLAKASVRTDLPDRRASVRTDLPDRRASLPLASSPFGGDVVAIAPHIYIERDISPTNAAYLLGLVDKARVRASFYYGELESTPDILFCSSPECYRKFGGIGLGYTRGNSILISPQGWRTAILSHEISHVELALRLGGLPEVLVKVPQWFDEGAAVMVSMAHEFSDKAWLEACSNGENAPPLSELESMADWRNVTGRNGVNMQRSYGTARQEVIRWYGVVGRRGLEQLIQALKDKQNFHLAYQTVESSAHLLLAARE